MSNIHKRKAASFNNDSPLEQSPRHSPHKPQREPRPRRRTQIGVEDIFSDSFIFRKDPAVSHDTKIIRRRFFFAFGIVTGLLFATFFIQSTPNVEFLASLSKIVGVALSDVDFAGMVPRGAGMEEFLGNLTTLRLGFTTLGTVTEDMFAIGDRLKEQGLKAKHPVILIPGIISTGLESWGTTECSRRYFRHRMWGTLNMFRAVLLDKECWTKHMQLDPDTGLDPPNVKLRAAQGLDAADYFIGGYWIWGKIIENLAAIGYDNNNMHLASYDWRLSFNNLEVRDRYFSRLQNTIEQAVRTEGEKAVVVAHSMGALVFLHFMQWATKEKGESWVNDHIHAKVNLAGPLLGVPKTLASSLSGEMRDTVQPLGEYVLERFYSRQERATLFRSWGGLASMMPKGGNAVWGDKDGAPDGDDPNYRYMLSFVGTGMQNLTIEDALNLLKSSSSPQYSKMLEQNYSLKAAKSKDEVCDWRCHHKKWSSALETKLPPAPNMTIWCMYGIGKSTERAYAYKESSEESDAREQVKVWIDTNAYNSGVVEGEGDGTVPLVSLGYMCVDGWRPHGPLNPAGSPIHTREYQHEPTSVIADIRGGSRSADHVDILGNSQLTEDIMRIVAGVDGELEDNILSPIKNISKKITERILNH